MQHRVKKRRFGRAAGHRRSLVRNLVRSLLIHERISTTHSRAKAIRPMTDHLITLAKRGDQHARRQAFAQLQDEIVIDKLFGQLAERFSDRQGGYTRIYRLGLRKGDGANLAQIELI